jgi:hypothetical protein
MPSASDRDDGLARAAVLGLRDVRLDRLAPADDTRRRDREAVGGESEDASDEVADRAGVAAGAVDDAEAGRGPVVAAQVGQGRGGGVGLAGGGAVADQAAAGGEEGGLALPRPQRPRPT